MTERRMCQVYSQLISKEFKVGLEVLSNTANGREIDSKARSYWEFLGIITQNLGTNKEKIFGISKNREYSIDTEIENSISSIFAFEFFTKFIQFLQSQIID